MTTLEIFEKVEQHLLAQNKKSELSNGTCAYRSDNGTMCAVGCLITDENYSRDLEGKSMGKKGGPLYKPVSKSLGMELDVTQVEMLIELQNIHDSCKVEYWPERLTLLKQKLFR